MSRTATIRWEFAGEERVFRLTISRLEALQEKCDAGPGFIWQLLDSGMAKSWHITETLIQGLIGGGMSEAAAIKLVKANAIPLADHIELAKAICQAAWSGVPDESPKEFGETVTMSPTASRSPMGKSGSRGSMDGQAPWDSTSVN